MRTTRLLGAAAAVALLAGAAQAQAPAKPATQPVPAAPPVAQPTPPVPAAETTPPTPSVAPPPAAAAPAATRVAPAPAATASAAVAAQGDIVDTLKASGQFKTFVKALDVTNMTGVLKTNRNLTVFAPTDAAFAALPAGELDRLMKDPASLQKLLTYHVVNATVDSTKIKGAKGGVKTVAGSEVVVDGSGATLLANNASIVQADVKPTNGTIHVVDKVLKPENAPSLAAAPAAPATTGATSDAAATTPTQPATPTQPTPAAPAPATTPATPPDAAAPADPEDQATPPERPKS